MAKRHKLRPGRRGEEIIGALLGLLFGYIAAEGILARYPHPLHWLAAGIIAGIAYLGTLLWYRWRYPPRPKTPASGRTLDARPPWYRRLRPRGHH